MGARAAKAPEMLPAAVAGAVLSTVATVVQLAAVLAAIMRRRPTSMAMGLCLEYIGPKKSVLVNVSSLALRP